METFDDISCEEYHAIYEELHELKAWMAAHEADTVAAEGSEEKDPVWNKGTSMPKDYTCYCGLYVHPSRRNPEAIHTPDCPYAKKQDKEQGAA